MTTEHSLAIVNPSVSPAEAVNAWKAYQEMKAALATDEDKQVIQGRTFLKKSYWRKVERFYSLNSECIKEWSEDLHGGRMFYAIYRASHPKTGLFADGDGADFAETVEDYHNSRATAHTRAKNRAISDLVGGGEVSAEEMGGTNRQAATASNQPDKTQHWCEKHQMNWFKRGKMPRYAHPQDGGWCNEPDEKPSQPIIEGKADVIEAQRPPEMKTLTDLYHAARTLGFTKKSEVWQALGISDDTQIGDIGQAWEQLKPLRRATGTAPATKQEDGA